MNRENVYGLIMCGGNSSRMGIDKSLINYNGNPQRYHLYEMLQSFCGKVFISINPEQIITAGPGYEFIIDTNEYRNTGPMGGLLSAFKDHPDKNWMIIGCDYPYLSKNDISAFTDFISNETEAAAFYQEGFYQPLIGFYSGKVKENLLMDFNSGQQSLQKFLQKMNADKFSDFDSKSIGNINTKEEMESAKRELSNAKACRTFSIKKITGEGIRESDDELTAEEPLEIAVSFDDEQKIISVTMRSPGDDEALAAGFLFTEGIINNDDAIQSVTTNASDENKIIVHLSQQPVLQKAERNFYTTSSCGVCGKASIDAIKTVSVFNDLEDDVAVSKEFLFSLPEKLREKQLAFNSTGGIHASAFFNISGELIFIAEDAGRHNALDKLIGQALMSKQLPLNNGVLLLSGRASFELVQKAMMAGIRFVAAIGAPSSLAVEAAEEAGITLAGFLRNGSFNLYSHGERLKIEY